MPNTSDIDWIEFHDSRIDWPIELSLGGDIHFNLGHLCTYYLVNPGRYEVWTCTARVRMRGCTSVTLTGMLESRDRISDGQLQNDGRRVDLIDCLDDGTAVNRLDISLDGGAKFSVELQHLVLSRPKRSLRLRDWIGPLAQTDP